MFGVLRTWLETVVAAKASGAVALSGIVVAWGVLIAGIDGEMAVEAAKTWVSALNTADIDGLGRHNSPWGAVLGTVIH